MRQVRDKTFGLRLIIAGVCILLLVLPGVVFAATTDTPIPGTEVATSPGANVTAVPTTPVPPVFLYLENATDTVNPPPLLIFDTPLIDNLTCTIYGIVDPGSANVTIVSILWDWGDNQIMQYHGFPNSHEYSSPGTYTLSIIAWQIGRASCRERV